MLVYSGNDLRTVYQDVKLFRSGKWKNIKWGNVCAFETVQESHTARREFLLLYCEIAWGTCVFLRSQNGHAWRAQNGHARRAMMTPLIQN